MLTWIQILPLTLGRRELSFLGYTKLLNNVVSDYNVIIHNFIEYKIL